MSTSPKVVITVQRMTVAPFAWLYASSNVLERHGATGTRLLADPDYLQGRKSVELPDEDADISALALRMERGFRDAFLYEVKTVGYERAVAAIRELADGRALLHEVSIDVIDKG